jgi:predicted ATP-grasp superfamily ATP-dependent carboligase
MPSVLITLGRFPKGLDLARSFKSAGWRVVVADPFQNHLLGISRSVEKSYQTPTPAQDPGAYIDALCAIVDDEKIDLVVPVSEEVMYVATLRERLSGRTQVFSMPAQALHKVHDKWLFVRDAGLYGLGVPQSSLASDPAAEAISQKGDFVIKARHSCGGGGVTFHQRGESFSSSADHIVQARIRGLEHSSCTLAHEGHVRATSIYRASVVSGTVAVGFMRVDHAAIEAWIAQFVAMTRWTGFISFDFIVDAQGQVHALECNPRVTSGIHFFETSDLAPAILDPSLTLRLRSDFHLQQFWACLQEAVKELPNLAAYGARLRDIWRRHDVTWSRSDPWPFLAMPWAARDLLARSWRSGLPLAVAATDDLAWTPAAQAQFGVQP